MNWTMERLKKSTERDYTTLVRVLFGHDSPTPLPADLENLDDGVGKVEFIDATLNDSQKDAIRFALASKEVALIHGPPGVSFFCEASKDSDFMSGDWLLCIMITEPCNLPVVFGIG